MGRLIDGTWETRDGSITDAKGAFVRKPTVFRNRITADGSSGHPAVAGRYHLFVASACPWAHRVLITRSLLGLSDAVSVSFADPLMLEHGWVFEDRVEDVRFLYQLYQRADPHFTGRVTVPVLWDTETKAIVNNESREIVRMFNTEMRDLGSGGPVLAPSDRHDEIDAAIDSIFEPINNGVYRAGFARTQEAHETAVRELFGALDHWESVLSRQRFMLGATMTEADLCLFTTLVRFDAVYNCHFKCNVRRVVDYENLWAFCRDVYQTPGVAETVDLPAIKQHYYGSHESVNPRRLVPLGPVLDFEAPHGRGSVTLD